MGIAPFIREVGVFNLILNCWMCTYFLVSHVSRKAATLIPPANQRVDRTVCCAGT